MTEDEAKKKWCPFADSRTTLRQDESSGEVRQSSFGCNKEGYCEPRCLGYQCMAWRWKKEFALQEIKTGIIQRVQLPASYDGSKYVSTEIESETYGYCGLAGNP